MPLIEVTIQSILPADEAQGRFHLQVSPEDTIEHLLEQLCQEAGTSPRADYCLRSRGHDILRQSDTLAESGVHDGAFLHWTNESVSTRTPCRCNILWILAALSFIIGTAGIVTVCVIRFIHISPEYEYAVVFDAGSTHTAMFVYQWEGSKLNGTAVAAQYGSRCTADGSGLAEFAENPQAAGKSLLTCIEVAKSAIPASKLSSTPVYLGATAGMRLLKIVNATACEAILDSVRATLSQSPFQFTSAAQSVRIISGSEEGAFSWITSNYATNAFRVKRPGVSQSIAYTIVPTIGALDLGGASTQITFQSSAQMPAGYSLETQLFGHNYTLYTHSYLCYGVKEVTNRIFARLVWEQTNKTVIQHPCLPSNYSITLSSKNILASPCVAGDVFSYGDVPDSLHADASATNFTFVGGSNNTQCASLLNKTLFNNSNCLYDSCSFNGFYQPPVSGLFYAFSSFYYVTDFLNLSTSNNSYFKYQDFLTATDMICNCSWPQLQKFPVTPQEKGNLMFYCLQSNFISLLLLGGYHFSDSLWMLINFVDRVVTTEIGWTLGFVLNESINYPTEIPQVAMYTWTFTLLMVLFCLFLVVGVGLAAQGKQFCIHVDKRSRRMSQYGAI
ncbi:hypothetical protein BsWGS_04018 [Bradybaena similaris]